ncbi:nucleoporin Ndc1 [Drosophila eugracilis]|uniref:nucleoporin Ndc1 n=1 Tax=Drosophila eugracilis TaxID=29029 RepID=UPI0007E8896D|nr:nucleoporin Ndc1 [Drosophila eugracilis]
MLEEDVETTGFVPQYYLMLPRKIKKILLYRFLFATLLCSWMDYQILAIFLCVNLFEVRNPLISLNEILRWTLFSAYTSIFMLLIRLGIVGYGLMLCHVHYDNPHCYRYRLSRMVKEFPIRFLIFSSIISTSIVSSWLYASFVDLIYENDSLGGSWYYLMTFGCFCGISYFHRQHGKCLKRFPLPIVHLNIRERLLEIGCYRLKNSGKEAFVPTLLFALIYWPCMGYWESNKINGVITGYAVIITQPKQLFQGWLLCTLILAKLHVAREVYSLIMQRQLSLINDSRRLHEYLDINIIDLITERFQYFLCMMRMKPMPPDTQRYNLSLPIAMAVDTTEIYGFQLLAARDFYAAMTGSLCSELYKMKCFEKDRNWDELLDVILEMVDNFLARMDSCMDRAPLTKVCNLLKNQVPKKTGIRPLVKPTLPPRGTCPICKRLHNCQKLQQFWCFCNLQNYLSDRKQRLGNFLWARLPVIPRYYHFWNDPDPMAQLNHELRCAEPLVWILQGLVSICVRSLKEDTFGYIQSDLSRILARLLNVEEKLITAQEIQARERRKLCGSHELLMLAVRRCLYKMLFTFAPHMDFILDDIQLKTKIKCRMALLP